MGTNNQQTKAGAQPTRIGISVLVAGMLGIALAALGIAFLVLRTPDLPADRLEKTYAGAPSQFLTLPSGLRVHARISGADDAPALLLLHGSASALFTFEAWRERFSATHRVISIDLPGHGLTGPDAKARYFPAAMVDLIEELRLALGIERLAIAGNSMGGELAWRYAAKYPDRMTALILLAPAGAELTLSDSEKRKGARGFALARVPVVNQLVRYITPKSLVKQGLLASFHDDSLVTPEKVTLYWSMLRRSGNRAALLERFRARPAGNSVASDRAEQMRLVRTPTLIIWGEEDAILPARGAPQIQEAIRESRLVLMPGTGHVPQEERPEESALEAANFLALWHREAEYPEAPIASGGLEP